MPPDTKRVMTKNSVEMVPITLYEPSVLYEEELLLVIGDLGMKDV